MKLLKDQKTGYDIGRMFFPLVFIGAALAGYWLPVGVITLGSDTAGVYVSSVFRLIRADIVAECLMFSMFLCGSMIAGRVFGITKFSLEKAVAALGLGMILFSLLMLAAGLAGFVSTGFTAGLAAVFLFSGVKELGGWADWLLSSEVSRLKKLEVLALVLGLTAYSIYYAWANLVPLDFDVLEYHLGVPAEYLSMGKITYLDHNVYASMPELAEMIFLGALSLSRDKFEGGVAAQLTSYMIPLFTASVIYLAGKEFFSKRAGAVAAFLFLTCPLIVHPSFQAYVENHLTFYTALAVYFAGKYVLKKKKPSGRMMVLLGVMIGGAVSCKYTAAPYVLVSVPFLLAVFGRPRAFLVTVSGALLVCIPWLARNAYFTGNPVYPLLSGWFGAPDIDALKWVHAHQPPEFELLPLLKKVFWTDREAFRVTGLLALFGLGQFFRDRRVMLWLAAFGVWVLIVWIFFTHQVMRFLVPLVPVISLLAAGGVDWLVGHMKKEWLKKAVMTAVILGSAAGLFNAEHEKRLNFFSAGEKNGDDKDEESASPRITLLVCTLDPEKFLEEIRHQLPGGANFDYPTARFVNSLPPGSKTLLVAEAQVFYFTGGIRYRTVFNDSPLDRMAKTGSDKGVLNWLKKRGVTHVTVNRKELARYSQTYAYVTENPETGEKVRVNGFSRHVGFRNYFLHSWLPENAEQVFGWWVDPSDPDRLPAFSVWRVKY